NPETIQKVVNATVKALEWMNKSAPEEIVQKLPEAFISGDKETYIKAVANAKPIFSIDGRFNEAEVETPLAVLRSFNDKVAATDIDLKKTYTNNFVDKAPHEGTN
ncbi:hypothetical protein DTX79_10860, partial [Bacilli bacterium]